MTTTTLAPVPQRRRGVNAQTGGAQARAPRLRALTAREVTVLELMALGGTNTEIGRRPGVSPLTVKSHRSRIAAALGSCGETSHSVAIGYARGDLADLPRPAPGSIHPLVPREQQVVVQAARGLTNAQIGWYLSISEDTVKTHMRRAMRKLNARSRAHAVLIGLQLGIVHAAPRPPQQPARGREPRQARTPRREAA